MPRAPTDAPQWDSACADPAKITGSKMDFVSRDQMIAAFITGAYHYV